MTVADTRVIWNTKKLAREFKMTANGVMRILRALGAKRLSKGNGHIGSKWIWECPDSN